VGARAKAVHAWPADKVERRPIKALIPAARNARTHTEAQVDQIAASIREWGWTMPVLVTDDGTIIAGHGRVRAAQKLRLADVPVMIATGWTKAQIQAYALADNKLGMNAGWDEALLALEIAELEEIGFDIGLIGFSDAEIAGLAVGEMTGLTDPDEVPEVPAEAVSQQGDLWVLGRHRLLCGDSTDPTAVKAVLGNVRPHLMVTDPPYGVDYDPAWRADANKWKGSNVKIGGKAMGRVSNDDSADWTEAWALFPGDGCVCLARWSAQRGAGEQPGAREVHDPEPDHLEQGPAGDQPRRLSLATRSVLVRCAQRQDRPLERQPNGIDDVGYPEAAGIRDRPQHAEAGRMHEAADREQLLTRAGGLRAIQRVPHHHHCCRDNRPLLPRDRTDAAIRRCRSGALAGLHGRDCEAGGRADVR
jgi:ParB-like chromosome segregation protein Spo0J